ncbi:hypothetical protein QE418_000002 [Microbacterium testaceum]|uniref:hypothetical protein n=1 Tax=Microbacterium TaxID=33882 RepID=UPI00277E9185|nr:MULTISPECIES: hypothetical protein [Microbacterium]MDQ1110554.1 hypothetical protein [Microbacterium testaceum]MDR6098901.1 hypothetical protein [Microbacterium sp. SORGH_AS_0454]
MTTTDFPTTPVSATSVADTTSQPIPLPRPTVSYRLVALAAVPGVVTVALLAYAVALLS